MTDIESKIEKINDLNKELKSLNDFIYVASKVWTGKVTLKSFISSTYGWFGSEEFKMNTTIKNRVLGVLEKYRDELELKLKEYIKTDK